MSETRAIIGAVEWISFPELGIGPVRARIDTGAHGSALHVEELKITKRDGIDWAEFRVPNRMRKATRWQECSAAVVDWRTVRSTSGHSETRPVIKSLIRLGEMEWNISISLTSRERMRYHFLLGRSAMKDRVLIDPAHAFLHGHPPRHRGKKL